MGIKSSKCWNKTTSPSTEYNEILSSHLIKMAWDFFGIMSSMTGSKASNCETNLDFKPLCTEDLILDREWISSLPNFLNILARMSIWSLFFRSVNTSAICKKMRRSRLEAWVGLERNIECLKFTMSGLIITVPPSGYPWCHRTQIEPCFLWPLTEMLMHSVSSSRCFLETKHRARHKATTSRNMNENEEPEC